MTIINFFLLTIIILIVLVSILVTSLIYNKKQRIEHKQKINSLEVENKIINEKILVEKEKFLTLTEEYFRRGYDEGLLRNKYTIRVDPIENISGRDYWVYSSEKIEIGYKYTLMNNEIPTEFTSTHYTKVISRSKIKEENINSALNMIEQIQNLNPSTFIINKSFESIKTNLKNQLQKK